MCRHCSRLVEDAAHKETVHKFMEVLTAGINRSLSERGKKPVTVDEVEFYATVPDRSHDYTGIPLGLQASVLKLLYRDLMDSVK
jgi:hypothetical protein